MDQPQVAEVVGIPVGTARLADLSAPAAPGPYDIPTLRRMIAPLSKEQLIELLAAAALDHPAVYTTCANMVKESPAARRLMIRNIAFSTKNEDFIKLFRQFGEIDDAVIVRDRDEKSKGYGFVTFGNGQGVENCFAAKELVLDGRQLLAKLAGDPYADFSSGGAGVSPQEKSRRKLFVRNLADQTDSDTLRGIFEQYGPLEECVVVCNTEGRSRGYGFVTFQEADASIKAVQQPQRVINGKVAFVAFATPSRTKNPPGGNSSPYAARRATQEVREAMMDTAGPATASLSPSAMYSYNPTGYPMLPYYGHPSTHSSFPHQPVGMLGAGYEYLQASPGASGNHPARRF